MIAWLSCLAIAPTVSCSAIIGAIRAFDLVPMAVAGKSDVHATESSSAHFPKSISGQLRIPTSIFVGSLVQVEVSCDESWGLAFCPPLLKNFLRTADVVLSPIVAPMRVEMPECLAILAILSIAKISLGVLIAWNFDTASTRDITNRGRPVVHAIELCSSWHLLHCGAESTIQLVLIHALLQTSNVGFWATWHRLNAVGNQLNLPRIVEVRVVNIPTQHAHLGAASSSC